MTSPTLSAAEADAVREYARELAAEAPPLSDHQAAVLRAVFAEDAQAAHASTSTSILATSAAVAS